MRRRLLLLLACSCVFPVLASRAEEFPALAPASPQLPAFAKAEAKALVQKLLACWQSGDEATFASLLHEKLVFAYPGGRFDRAGLLKTFADYHKEKKDIKVYFADFFVSNGQRHVTAYQFAATDVASGLRFAVGTGVIFKVVDGKIIELKEYWDSEVAGRQKAGELPLDEGIVTPWPSTVLLRPEKIN